MPLTVIQAVHVVEADDGHKMFELTLVNGHPIEAEVLGSDTDPVKPGEDRRTVSRGYPRCRREEDPLRKLAAAVHAIVE